MNCPKCGKDSLTVINTRAAPGNMIRRRRKCLKCDHDFTTYEWIPDVVQVRVTQQTMLKILRGGKK